MDEWFATLDLRGLAEALDVKVQLTGRDSFELEYGVDAGEGHVRQAVAV